VILYLTYWFPARARSRMIALFLAAAPLSTLVGAPLSGYVLGLDGAAGLRGWQWMFILEGLPTVLVVSIFCSCFQTVRNGSAGSPGKSAIG